MGSRPFFVAIATVSCVAGTASAQDRVTFSEHIAPVIYEHCVPCHRPEGPAPFSLITYDDVRQRATLIAQATLGRYMPPWKPDAPTGTFVGERRLTDDEIALFARWAKAGAPEGNRAALPAPPRWGEWQLGTPDLIVTLPEYRLRADGLDVFRNFVVAIPGRGVRYVRGVEFRPGSAAVHHANIRIDYTATGERMDQGDPGPGYEGVIPRTADYPDGHFLGWTPGQVPPVAPKGLAWRLDEQGRFVVQLHMRPTGKPELIRPAIGLFFTRRRADPVAGDAAARASEHRHSRRRGALPLGRRIHRASRRRGQRASAALALPRDPSARVSHSAGWQTRAS